MPSSIRLLVGLGNPSSKYNQTRHNVGREFVDYLVDETDNNFLENRQSEYFRLSVFFGVHLGERLTCAKLLCFMNESGPAIKGLMDKEGITPKEVLVVVDDFMIPFGTLRFRSQGSSGGHNGLKSIIETFGSEDFPRLRVGIGPTPPHEDPADFVLKRFSKMEISKLPDLFQITVDGLKVLFSDGLPKAMEFLNKKHF